jgi:hypothetical protein
VSDQYRDERADALRLRYHAASLDDVDNLPPPEVIAQEIVEDLQVALAEFEAIAVSLASREQLEPEGETS